MEKNAILIFGGGDNQLTLIKAAKNRGYHTVVIDPNSDAPGKSIADVFEIVAPKDFETTSKLIERYNIKGIATAQMENPLLMMAQIAEKYGFIFPTLQQIKVARHKFLMKDAFLKADVPCAMGKLFKKDEAITKRLLNGLRFPLIIKPADAFSSRGVIKCEIEQEIFDNESFTRSFASDGSLIIEEFLEGPEYSVEAITYHGCTHIIQYTEKIITPYPYTVEMAHIQPAEFSLMDKTKIDKIVISAIKSLKLDNCATHTELKLTKEGPMIIEIGARLGGDYISSYLTLHSTGVDMDAAAADIAMGRKPELEKKLSQYSGIFYFHLGEGKKVCAIENWKEVLDLNNIVNANIFVKPGEIIPALTDSAKRSGFVIIKSLDKRKLIEDAEIAINKLKSKIKRN